MGQCECAKLDWSDVIAQCFREGKPTPEHHPDCESPIEASAIAQPPSQICVADLESQILDAVRRARLRGLLP